MRDWTGTTVRADALSVPCRYCNAREGQPCVSKATGKPIDAFPAHTCRINDSQKAGA